MCKSKALSVLTRIETSSKEAICPVLHAINVCDVTPLFSRSLQEP